MSVLMNLAIFPTDKGISVSKYVSEVVEMIALSGYDYRLTPMATIVETENLQECLSIIEKANEILRNDCERVYATATFDIQTNKPKGRITSKIISVESKIGIVNK